MHFLEKGYSFMKHPENKTPRLHFVASWLLYSKLTFVAFGGKKSHCPNKYKTIYLTEFISELDVQLLKPGPKYKRF